MEENVSQWVIDPYRFQCSRYGLTVDNMAAEFEKIARAPCSVSMMETPAGHIRQFACGEVSWFVTETEETCQRAVTALKEPESGEFTWMIVPDQAACDQIPGTITDLVKAIEKEVGKGCKITRLNSKDLDARQISCGDDKNWIVSEDPVTCQQLQDYYNQLERYSI